MTIGIYLLYFNKGEETNVYIGQSITIERRFKYEHTNRLLSNTHENNLLQQAYNLYGPPELLILEVTTPSMLNIREKHWINTYNSYVSGLNLSPGGTGYSSGCLHPDALYSEDTYLAILKLLAEGNTSQQVSTYLNVSIHVVRSIKHKEKHCYLEITHPDLYKRATSIIQKRGPTTSNTQYTLVSPEGVNIVLSNFSEFARNYSLDPSNVRKLALGIKKSYNGWTRLLP